ncbi:MAG TPA: diiron oxygenase [Mycobacteriales bacterium]|nr:diiron oxygenase [Mycobacteriales bacterium]
MATIATEPRSAEQTAERLLHASAEHWFDPLTAIDWDAPLAPDRGCMPAHRVSLFGTELWDRMSSEQRLDLSRHEIASLAGVGIWLETILLQMLARHIYDRDPRTRHVQYALTEIADECRHSVMFARMIEKLGCPNYRPQGLAHALGRLMKTVSAGPEIFAAALIAEEILDRMQREGMADASLQPLVREVSRIHVVEEARHVRYAREALIRVMPRLGPLQRERVRFATAASACVISSQLIHPGVYAAVGLDPTEARRAAATNPHHRATLAWAAERLAAFFTEVGVLGGPSTALWRRAGLLS